jgi:hypothetical protein
VTCIGHIHEDAVAVRIELEALRVPFECDIRDALASVGVDNRHCAIAVAHVHTMLCPTDADVVRILPERDRAAGLELRAAE